MPPRGRDRDREQNRERTRSESPPRRPRTLSDHAAKAAGAQDVAEQQPESPSAHYNTRYPQGMDCDPPA